MAVNVVVTSAPAYSNSTGPAFSVMVSPRSRSGAFSPSPDQNQIENPETAFGRFLAFHITSKPKFPAPTHQRSPSLLALLIMSCATMRASLNGSSALDIGTASLPNGDATIK